MSDTMATTGFDGSVLLSSPRSWRGMTMHEDVLGKLRDAAPGHVPPHRGNDGFEQRVHKELAYKVIDGLHDVPLPASWSSAPPVSTRTELRERRVIEKRLAEQDSFRQPSFSPREYTASMRASSQVRDSIHGMPRPLQPAPMSMVSPRDGYTRTAMLQWRREQALISEAQSLHRYEAEHSF